MAKEAKETKKAGKAGKAPKGPSVPIGLQVKYKNEMVPALMKELGLKSSMQVPNLKKIVINLSTAEAVKNPKVLNTAVDELTAITGQKAVITKAKKSISNF